MLPILAHSTLIGVEQGLCTIGAQHLPPYPPVLWIWREAFHWSEWLFSAADRDILRNYVQNPKSCLASTKFSVVPSKNYILIYHLDIWLFVPLSKPLMNIVNNWGPRQIPAVHHLICIIQQRTCTIHCTINFGTLQKGMWYDINRCEFLLHWYHRSYLTMIFSH